MSSSRPPDEAEHRLVLLAMAGDDAAFQALVLRHQSRVRLFLRRTCGDAALADDLAQAVFLKAWRGLSTVRDPAAFGGWLRRIALNAALDALRRAAPDAWPLEEDDLPAGSPDPADQRLDLEAALMRLSLPARTCVLLHHGEGLSHGQVADETGLPTGTVKSHLARATALLRGWLAPWKPTNGRPTDE